MNTDGHAWKRASREGREGREGLLDGGVGQHAGQCRTSLLAGRWVVTGREGVQGIGGCLEALRVPGGKCCLKGRYRDLGNCGEVAKRVGCLCLNSGVVGFAKAVREDRHRDFSGGADIGQHGNSTDSIEANWGFGIRGNREEGGECICSKLDQAEKGEVRGDWRVGLVHEMTEFTQGWHCSCPQHGKGSNGPIGEACGSSIHYGVGKLADEWKSASSDGGSKFDSPSRRIVLDPFHEEREGRDADVVDCLLGLLHLFLTLRADGFRAEPQNPIV